MTTSTGDPATDPDASSTVFTSDTTFTLVNMDGVSGSGPLGVSVIADGAAFGTDTYTSADIAASVVDGAYADSVSAVVLVTSASESPDADAIALANAIAELIGEGNVMIGITHNATMTTTDGDSQTSVTTAFASVTALQFDTDGTGNVETSGCGCDGSSDETTSLPDTIVVLADEDSVLNGADLDGNLATFDIAANAFGENTLVDVQADAFALEDQFSSVTATVFVLIP